MAIFKKYSNNDFSDGNIVEIINNNDTNIFKKYSPLINNIKSNNFTVINKESEVITVLNNDKNNNKNNVHHYLDKLKQLTSEIAKLNKEKVVKYNKHNNFNNHLYKSESNNYKYVRVNYKNSNSNNIANTLNNYLVIANKYDPHSKINENKLDQCNVYDSSQNSKDLKNVNHLKTELHHSNSIKTASRDDNKNLDLDKHIKSKSSNLNTVSNNQDGLYNIFITQINNKIDELVNKLGLSFAEINVKINSKDQQDSLLKDVINNHFSDLDNKITEIKNICDLNSVEIDNLSDHLTPIDFKELITLLKEMNVNIHMLINQQKKLNQDDTEVSNEIRSLETKFKLYSQEQLDNLSKQINLLQKNQHESSLAQKEYKDVLISEMQILHTILKSKNDITTELQDRLNYISTKQEDLLQEAISIKSFIESKKKENTETENTTNKGINVLIEEIKSNNNVFKKQDIFNEKIHNDMEIIKKSIMKLIDEQAKDNVKQTNVHTHKPIKDDLGNNNKTSLATKSDVVNGYQNVMSKNSNAPFQHIAGNRLQDSKESKVAAQRMAIGKLKEALDLDSIHTIKELRTEYIDEIIEEKVTQNTNQHYDKESNNISHSSVSEKDQNKSVDSKQSSKEKELQKNTRQNTFILDNSKFFN